jgi:hypothetical protein
VPDKKILGKEAVADVLFVELSLSSVTLGKVFAECFSGFAECFMHSAKHSILASSTLTQTQKKA